MSFKITRPGDFLFVAADNLCPVNYPPMKGKTVIKIQGRLDGNWKEFFEGMDISYEGNDTLLTGMIKDEAQLHGIMNKIRDLNLHLLSINTHDK